MENIAYHKATYDDIQTLVDYRVEFQLALSGEQPAEAVNALREHLVPYFKKALENNTFMAYIARSGNTIAGIGGLVVRDYPGGFRNLSGTMGYLMNMYTVPAFRRKGICAAILNLLVDDAHRSGIMLFELHATKEGEYVYKQNGFTMHDEPTYRRFMIADK